MEALEEFLWITQYQPIDRFSVVDEILSEAKDRGIKDLHALCQTLMDSISKKKIKHYGSLWLWLMQCDSGIELFQASGKLSQQVKQHYKLGEYYRPRYGFYWDRFESEVNNPRYDTINWQEVPWSKFDQLRKAKTTIGNPKKKRRTQRKNQKRKTTSNHVNHLLNNQYQWVKPLLKNPSPKKIDKLIRKANGYRDKNYNNLTMIVRFKLKNQKSLWYYFQTQIGRTLNKEKEKKDRNILRKDKINVHNIQYEANIHLSTPSLEGIRSLILWGFSRKILGSAQFFSVVSSKLNKPQKKYFRILMHTILNENNIDELSRTELSELLRSVRLKDFNERPIIPTIRSNSPNLASRNKNHSGTIGQRVPYTKRFSKSNRNNGKSYQKNSRTGHIKGNTIAERTWNKCKGKTIQEIAWKLGIPSKALLEEVKKEWKYMESDSVIRGQHVRKLAKIQLPLKIRSKGIDEIERPKRNQYRRGGYSQPTARIIYTPVNGQPGWRRKR